MIYNKLLQHKYNFIYELINFIILSITLLILLLIKKNRKLITFQITRKYEVEIELEIKNRNPLIMAAI